MEPARSSILTGMIFAAPTLWGHDVNWHFTLELLNGPFDEVHGDDVASAISHCVACLVCDRTVGRRESNHEAWRRDNDQLRRLQLNWKDTLNAVSW